MLTTFRRFKRSQIEPNRVMVKIKLKRITGSRYPVVHIRMAVFICRKLRLISQLRTLPTQIQSKNLTILKT